MIPDSAASQPRLRIPSKTAIFLPRLPPGLLPRLPPGSSLLQPSRLPTTALASSPLRLLALLVRLLITLQSQIRLFTSPPRPCLQLVRSLPAALTPPRRPPKPWTRLTRSHQNLPRPCRQLFSPRARAKICLMPPRPCRQLVRSLPAVLTPPRPRELCLRPPRLCLQLTLRKLYRLRFPRAVAAQREL